VACEIDEFRAGDLVFGFRMFEVSVDGDVVADMIVCQTCNVTTISLKT